jgi:hypothetical protein
VLAEVAGGPHWTLVGDDEIAVFVVPHPSPAAAGRGRDLLYRSVAGGIATLLTGHQDPESLH